MSKINLKKFSIYEFTLDVDGELVEVIYKKDEENSADSSIKINDGEKTIDIPVNLLTALHDALNEIDPYGFVFSDLDGEK